MATDPLDIASELQLSLNDSSLRVALNKIDFDSPSALFCIDCDAPIPERRRALGGVKRCVECQCIEEERR